MQTPLLLHQQVDAMSRSSGATPSWSVVCGGVPGTLHIGDDATTHWEPLEASSSSCCCGGCCTQHHEQQISGSHVVGAALDSPNSFRVWHFAPVAGSGSAGGSSISPRFRLLKTLPFACASGSEASAAVRRLRQAATWRGRDRPPRVAAVINPTSGQGRAARAFEQQVVPVLEDAAGMTLTTLVTHAPGHASELVATLDLAAHDLLLFVGGDGTVYEGLQGLLGRPDWDAARLLPIAHVPAGSGNGLAQSCGLRDAATAAFAVAKGLASPMDVASVLQPPGTRRFMSLSVAFGTLANLDVNTEPLRWMGDARFTLGALWEVVRGKFYSAAIAWLPADDDDEDEQQRAAAAAAASSGRASGVRSLREQIHASPSPDSSRSPSPQSVTGAGGSSAEEQQQQVPSMSISSFPMQGPELPILQQQLGRVPLSVPPPGAAASVLGPKWRVLAAPLPLFACVNPPFIAATSKLNPWGGLHRGHFNMLLLDVQPGLVGRLQAVDLLSKAETGQHMGSPYMVQHRIRAMLFEPRDADTYLQLDGEVVPNAPIYLEVHAGLIRVIISPAHPDEPAADASRHHFGGSTRAAAAVVAGGEAAAAAGEVTTCKCTQL